MIELLSLILPADVEATDMLSNTKTGNVMSSKSYALKCTPAQRMF